LRKTLHQGRYELTEILPIREWARVGAFGGRKIPDFHPLEPAPEFVQQLHAFNQRVFDAGFKTQNYDKGFDRSMRKFDQNDEVAAVCAVYKGAHQDHGCAVYFTQGSRRRLLLDTMYGLSDDEVL
jgi:hypothetical protein